MTQSYSPDELRELFGSVGSNVAVHRSVALFSPKLIHIGSNVRIDCFALLSAGSEGIHIGDQVHLAAGVYLFGSGGKIVVESFANVSSRVAIYTASDDYKDGFLTNPTVPMNFRKVREAGVTLLRHAIVGTGSVVLPGVTLGVGASVGAMTLVNQSVDDFAVVAGIPFRVIGERNRRLLEKEKEFLSSAQS